MQVIEAIRYGQHPERGIGDLYLPDQPENAPVALVIHGGGWNAMDKHGLAGIAQLICEQGYAAYNINYRLIDHAPWPACGDDCIAAANFLLSAGHEAMQNLDRSKLLIIGASAGGHLTLWTGLNLPAQKVKAMISISGPTDLLWRYHNRTDHQTWQELLPKFFDTENPTDEMIAAASPVNLVKPDSPPLLCIHSTNDELVLPDHSQMMVDQYAAVGLQAKHCTYPGPGELHGIWIEDESLDPRKLLPEPTSAIVEFLKTL